MPLSREDILKKINASMIEDSPIIGVSVGAGISAKSAEIGGADMLLALNSGRFRQMGLSSLAGMMPFQNSNKLVLEFGKTEILRAVKNIPVIFGLCASDPTVNIELFIEKICEIGFSGINNYPTVGIIDGQYRQALENENLGFIHEVNSIKIARSKNIFTVAFVFNAEQAKQMADVGADVICAHLGFTRGGTLGVKRYLSYENAVIKSQEIFDGTKTINSKVIKLIYGGPIKSAEDAEFLYKNTEAVGYIGGSSFDRIPTEKAIQHTTQEFKSHFDFNSTTLNSEDIKQSSYIFMIKKYVTEHYNQKITLEELAKDLHLNRNYLSFLFKKEMGCTYTRYLIKYRINKAIDLLRKKEPVIAEVAELTGFSDQAYFSRMFKKITGVSPSDFIKL